MCLYKAILKDTAIGANGEHLGYDVAGGALQVEGDVGEVAAVNISHSRNGTITVPHLTNQIIQHATTGLAKVSYIGGGTK